MSVAVGTLATVCRSRNDAPLERLLGSRDIAEQCDRLEQVLEQVVPKVFSVLVAAASTMLPWVPAEANMKALERVVRRLPDRDSKSVSECRFHVHLHWLRSRLAKVIPLAFLDLFHCGVVPKIITLSLEGNEPCGVSTLSLKGRGMAAAISVGESDISIRGSVEVVQNMESRSERIARLIACASSPDSYWCWLAPKLTETPDRRVLIGTADQRAWVRILHAAPLFNPRLLFADYGNGVVLAKQMEEDFRNSLSIDPSLGTTYLECKQIPDDHLKGSCNFSHPEGEPDFVWDRLDFDQYVNGSISVILSTEEVASKKARSRGELRHDAGKRNAGRVSVRLLRDDMELVGALNYRRDGYSGMLSYNRRWQEATVDASGNTHVSSVPYHWLFEARGRFDDKEGAWIESDTLVEYRRCQNTTPCMEEQPPFVAKFKHMAQRAENGTTTFNFGGSLEWSDVSFWMA